MLRYFLPTGLQCPNISPADWFCIGLLDHSFRHRTISPRRILLLRLIYQDKLTRIIPPISQTCRTSSFLSLSLHIIAYTTVSFISVCTPASGKELWRYVFSPLFFSFFFFHWLVSQKIPGGRTVQDGGLRENPVEGNFPLLHIGWLFDKRRARRREYVGGYLLIFRISFFLSVFLLLGLAYKAREVHIPLPVVFSFLSL